MNNGYNRTIINPISKHINNSMETRNKSVSNNRRLLTRLRSWFLTEILPHYRFITCFLLFSTKILLLFNICLKGTSKSLTFYKLLSKFPQKRFSSLNSSTISYLKIYLPQILSTQSLKLI